MLPLAGCNEDAHLAIMADDEIDYRKHLPDQLRKYVGYFVELTLCEGEKQQGWVYTIDPVSYSIVIAKHTEENSTNSKPIVIVMANAIKQLRVIETTEAQPVWLNDFAVKKAHTYTEEELQKRKASVIEWLDKNRVPIVENSNGGGRESVHVIGGLVVEPPYNAESCQGTNEIVLERVRKLISAMPND